jgi:hypothetical protein
VDRPTVRQDPPPDLAEADPAAAHAGGRAGDDYLVAVEQEAALLALDGDRLLADPGQLQEGATLLLGGARDRAEP